MKSFGHVRLFSAFDVCSAESLLTGDVYSREAKIETRDYKGLLLRTHRKDLPRLASEVYPNVDTVFREAMLMNSVVV